MIRLATKDDLNACRQLLKKLNPSIEVDSEYLYLGENPNGFTIVILNGSEIIGMSTFSIRKQSDSCENYKFLYWENLIVEEKNRDGMAYLMLISYLRKLLKRNEYADIYFLARRKKILNLHKKAGFQNYGYVGICLDSIKLGRSLKDGENFKTLSYEEFRNNFLKKHSQNDLKIQNFRGFEHVSTDIIHRQLKYKSGSVLIDFCNNIYFVRKIISNRFISINLIIPGNYVNNYTTLSFSRKSLININLGFVKFSKKNEILSVFCIRNYEALNFAQIAKFESFQIWEHDAW